MRIRMMKISYKTLKIGWKQNNKIIYLTKIKMVQMFIGGVVLGYFIRPYIDIAIKIIKNSLK